MRWIGILFAVLAMIACVGCVAQKAALQSFQLSNETKAKAAYNLKTIGSAEALQKARFKLQTAATPDERQAVLDDLAQAIEDLNHETSMIERAGALDSLVGMYIVQTKGGAGLLFERLEKSFAAGKKAAAEASTTQASANVPANLQTK